MKLAKLMMAQDLYLELVDEYNAAVAAGDMDTASRKRQVALNVYSQIKELSK